MKVLDTNDVLEKVLSPMFTVVDSEVRSKEAAFKQARVKLVRMSAMVNLFNYLATPVLMQQYFTNQVNLKLPSTLETCSILTILKLPTTI